jgi:dihydrofolate reductase
MSLDGCIAGPDDGPGLPLGRGGEALFTWFGAGDAPSRFYPSFRMSAASAAYFDAFADRIGAVISGRRTYDISNAWGGDGPLHGVPLFVMTHRPPGQVPSGASTYTFVEGDIATVVAQARAVAGDKDVSLMGSATVQQALRQGLLDILAVDLVPVVLGGGVRLLDGLDAGGLALELLEVVDAPGVIHLKYRVVK